jgi:hypothetical protein
MDKLIKKCQKHFESQRTGPACYTPVSYIQKRQRIINAFRISRKVFFIFYHFEVSSYDI